SDQPGSRPEPRSLLRWLQRKRYWARVFSRGHAGKLHAEKECHGQPDALGKSATHPWVQSLQLSGGPNGDRSNACTRRPVDPRLHLRNSHRYSYLPDYESAFSPRSRASENAIRASTQPIRHEVEAPVPPPAILRASSCVNRQNLLWRRPIDVEPGFSEDIAMQ